MSASSTYTAMALGGIMLLSSNILWAQSAGLTPVGIVEAGPTRQAPRDPAEDLLVAYRLRNEAEKEAAAGNYNQALKKARQAEKMMAIIVRDHPDWKTNMMSYLRGQLAKNMTRYQEEAAKAPIPTGRQPGRPVPQEVNLNLPGIVQHAESQSGLLSDGLPEDAATNKELREELARLRTECKTMAQSLLELSDKYRKSQQELVTARAEQKEYKERYETLLQQVTEERKRSNEVVDSFARRLAEAEDKLRESERARKEAEERAEKLAGQLAQTQAELERVTRERDALKAENEQLRAIVELNSPEKTKALLDQNLTLAEQLKAARARVEALEAQMAGSTDEKDVLAQQLSEARSEADRLREQMGLVYDENRGYRRRISELTERLNNIEAELNAAAAAPNIDPALVEENRLLKEVIEKQRRTIAMQEEGRKLLVETYKQLKNNNSEMAAELQKLDNESRLELTDAEKQLLASLNAAPGNGEGTDGTAAVRRALEVQTLASLADKAFSKARYTSAEQLYRTLYEFRPDHVPGLVNLGTILLYRNKCEESIEYLQRATRLAPELPITYYLAGISHYRMDRMEEAERMFVRTIELDPGNAEAFFYLANIEGISGRHEEALKHFAAAVKLNPGLNDAHYNMARLYAEQGRIPDAARAYDRAIQSGAEPDPEFDNYLRNHPDNVKKPGADLVAEVEPEAEAARLRADDAEVQQILADNTEPSGDTEPSADSQAQEPEQVPAGETSAYTTEQQAVVDEMTRLQAIEIKAAPTPSAAGKVHETNRRRFSTVRVRTNAGGYRHRVKLRLKRPEPQRIRERGGDIERLKPSRKNSKK